MAECCQIKLKKELDQLEKLHLPLTDKIKKQIWENSEIFQQMTKYNAFIKDNEDKIIEYYNKLLEIMNKIGVNNPHAKKRITKLSLKASLIIAKYNDKKSSGKRTNRIDKVEKLLKIGGIEHKMIEFRGI